MLPKVVTQGNLYTLSSLVSSFDMQSYHSKTTDSMCGPRGNTSQEIHLSDAGLLLITADYFHTQLTNINCSNIAKVSLLCCWSLILQLQMTRNHIEILHSVFLSFQNVTSQASILCIPQNIITSQAPMEHPIKLWILNGILRHFHCPLPKPCSGLSQ